MFRGASIAVLAALITVPLALHAQDKVTIGGSKDWAAWTMNGKALGGLADQSIVNVSQSGIVSLGRINSGEVNVAPKAPFYKYRREATDLVGGIRLAGTGSATALRIIDGDPATYWAPDPRDAVEQWKIEVDLGFVVTAKRLRLVFPEGKAALPAFRIFTSEGARKFITTNSQALDYEQVAGTRRPNEKRVFEVIFDAQEHYIASGGVTANPAGSPETVFVPQADAQGNLLPGRLIHYVKIVFDAKIPNSGVAELEVYSMGLNLAEGILSRGGWIDAAVDSPVPTSMFDGLMWTEYWVSQNVNWEASGTGGWFKIDLGAILWIDTIRFIGLPAAKSGKSSNYVDGFKMYVSDGTEAAYSAGSVWKMEGRDLVWEEVSDFRNDHLPQLLTFDITFSPKRVRYIFFHHDYGSGYYRSVAGNPPRFYEMQIFGAGAIPGVTLRSGLIDLGSPKNIVSASWKGATPERTRIELRTRTGNDVLQVIQYYSSTGMKLTKKEFDLLPPRFRGKPDTTIAPVDSVWSGWSSFYATSGERFKSPSPRRYMFVEANLFSENPDDTPTLDSITFSLTPSAVSGTAARIQPNRADVGRPQRFWYSIVPTKSSSDVGFDGVRIGMPGRADSVALKIDGKLREPNGAIVTSADSLFVPLPETIKDKRVEIGFVVSVFESGTIFESRLSNTAVRNLSQVVEADRTIKHATTVFLPGLARSDRLVGDVSVDPGIITPNGDGANDVATIGFVVQKVSVAADLVTVGILDLRGRVVRELYEHRLGSGQAPLLVWDGKDDRGDLVPPGTYVLRIRVHGAVGEGKSTRAISVVY